MRKIKFRGQGGQGKWHYGDLLTLRNRICIIDPSTGMNYQIKAHTLGQYTGLKDKNGTEIYEGDTIKTKKYGKIIARSNVADYDTFKVVYEPAVFRLENMHRGFNLVGNSNDFEVIGNIHDNPELLGGRK